MPQTNERAFESCVQEILLTSVGWKAGANAEWDKGRALFPAQVLAMIAQTQPKLWGGIVQRTADNDKIVSRYTDDKAFGDAAFALLSKAMYGSILTEPDLPKPT